VGGGARRAGAAGRTGAGCGRSRGERAAAGMGGGRHPLLPGRSGRLVEPAAVAGQTRGAGLPHGSGARRAALAARGQVVRADRRLDSRGHRHPQRVGRTRALRPCAGDGRGAGAALRRLCGGERGRGPGAGAGAGGGRGGRAHPVGPEVGTVRADRHCGRTACNGGLHRQARARDLQERGRAAGACAPLCADQCRLPGGAWGTAAAHCAQPWRADRPRLASLEPADPVLDQPRVRGRGCRLWRQLRLRAGLP
jgi:hypothetical protein